VSLPFQIRHNPAWWRGCQQQTRGDWEYPPRFVHDTICCWKKLPGMTPVVHEPAQPAAAQQRIPTGNSRGTNPR